MNVIGSKMLKVCGILMIIGASLSLVLALIGIAAILAVGSVFNAGAVAFLAILGVLIAFVAPVLQFIAGIMGVKNWAKPEKAGTCITFGIIIIVLNVINNIFSYSNSDSFGAWLFGLALGLIIPILYLKGAYNLRNLPNSPQYGSMPYGNVPPAAPPVGTPVPPQQYTTQQQAPVAPAAPPQAPSDTEQ